MCGDQLDSRFSSWKVSRQGLQVRAGFYKAAPTSGAPGQQPHSSLGLMLRQLRVQGDVLPGLLGRTLQSIQMKRFGGGNKASL